MSPAPWENWFRSGDIGVPPQEPELHMEFMLTFRGYVPSNGCNSDVHEIREQLHHQLKNLPRLDTRFQKAETKVMHDASIRGADYMEPHEWFKWDVGGYEYVPLVQSHQDRFCQFDIIWVRPVKTGATSGRDLDNCYRNLSDALTLPNEKQMGGVQAPPDPGARRRYCLLENDSLVTGFAVKAFRSLEDVEGIPPFSGIPQRQRPIAQVDLLVHVAVHERTGFWGAAGVP